MGDLTGNGKMTAETDSAGFDGAGDGAAIGIGSLRTFFMGKFQGEMAAEYQRQVEKFGEPTEDSIRTLLAVMGEEFGEVCRAALERKHDEMHAELVQLATVAMALAIYADSGETVW